MNQDGNTPAADRVNVIATRFTDAPVGLIEGLDAMFSELCATAPKVPHEPSFNKKDDHQAWEDYRLACKEWVSPLENQIWATYPLLAGFLLADDQGSTLPLSVRTYRVC
jgi:hypothetical protein